MKIKFKRKTKKRKQNLLKSVMIAIMIMIIKSLFPTIKKVLSVAISQSAPSKKGGQIQVAFIVTADLLQVPPFRHWFVQKQSP